MTIARLFPSSLARVSREFGKRACARLQPANASEAVDNSAHDGYTLLWGNVGPLAIGPGLYKQLGYDVARDFEPVSLVAILPFVLFTSPVLPANSVVELLAYARGHPGELNFGSTGVGSGLHLIGELFKSEAAIEIVHVPYKGVAQALPEMMPAH